MSQDTQPTAFVTSHRDGHLGVVTLDRPQALNALDLGMCEGIHRALDAFAADDSVRTVLMASTSPKAFCAGGDIKAIRAAALAGDFAACRHYFVTEYAMDLAIADYPKPYVAILYGPTMGGGLGLSAHGTYRVATETLVTSMPETAIGFLPDVGASWALPRLAGGGARGLALAIYLGLTGARMSAADALHTGLATHFVRQERTQELARALADLSVEEALAQTCSEPEEAGESAIAGVMDRIEEVFSADTIAEMIARLQAGPQDEWAEQTSAALRSMSPTSMVATVELFRHGAQAPSLSACLDAEVRLGEWIVRRPDFAEGVRAVLVDKTRDAAWHPADPAEVDVDGIREALHTP